MLGTRLVFHLSGAGPKEIAEVELSTECDAAISI
ncbi:MAG: hypothetical protein RI898_1193, partial [Actinomycetota bacterium]